MTTVQEVAHVAVGFMTAFAAILLVLFVILRPNFDIGLRVLVSFLAVGLAAISAFSGTLALRAEGWLIAASSGGAVIGATMAVIAGALLARTAFRSHLLSALHHRVEAHRRTLDRLRRSRGELERRVRERTREVHEQEKRLRIALRDSNIAIAMQDPELRYVWMRNAPEGFNAQDVIGKSDEDFLPEAAARVASAAKRKVIETGEDVTFELCIERERGGGRTRYFDVTTEPYHDEAGDLQGLLSVSVETTEKRQREELLKATLLEVSHRTKNQLAVLISIARRLADNKPDTATFLPAFEARMRALSICQDVLVDNDWNSVPLKDLVRAQLEPYLSRVKGGNAAVELIGPEVSLLPTAVQNVGIIIHELALNAFDSGALEAPAGPIRISWEMDEATEPKSGTNGRSLTLAWDEAGARSPPAPKFLYGFGVPMAEKIAKTALGGSLDLNSDKERLGISARLKIDATAFAA